MQHSAGSDFVAPEISITISYPLLRAASATRDKGRVLAYFLSPLILHPSHSYLQNAAMCQALALF